MIKDSGNRTEFETGAVRDIQEGKGRFDLMPMDVLRAITKDQFFVSLEAFRRHGYDEFLIDAFREASNDFYGFAYEYEAILDLAKHFEEGAKKYGENNWQKGIPVSRYIDSACRHYCKARAKMNDESHDRACLWNLMCAYWTAVHKPELDDYSERSEEPDD